MEYSEQYRHPKWQKRRLEKLDQAGFECQNCGEKDEQLHVHHVRYEKDAKVWEYSDNEFEVLCEKCHLELHNARDSFKSLLTCIVSPSAFEVSLYRIAEGINFHDQGFPERFVESIDNAIGYGTGYLKNFDHEEIMALVEISPSLLKKFIKDNKNG